MIKDTWESPRHSVLEPESEKSLAEMFSVLHTEARGHLSIASGFVHIPACSQQSCKEAPLAINGCPMILFYYSMYLFEIPPGQYYRIQVESGV